MNVDFTVTGGNKNAEIKLSKKYDGTVSENLEEIEAPTAGIIFIK